MARKRERTQINLDKVERKLTAQIKALKPEYADFTPTQVVKMELRYRLFGELQRLRKAEKQDNSDINNGWSGILSRGPASFGVL